jgi:hypothetical protein
MPESISFTDLQAGGTIIPPKDSPAPIQAGEVIPFSEFQVPEPPVRTAKEKIFKGFEITKGAVEGDAEFDFPEVYTEIGNLPSPVKTAFGFFMEPSTEGKAEILRKHVPDAKFFRDKDQNIYTEIGGKKFYINKPGFSKQDVLTLGSEIAKFSPGGLAAGAITKAASPIAKFVAQALAAGTTSLTSDEIAQAFGSDQPTDIGDALIAAGFAGGAEIAAPMLGRIAKKVLRGGGLDAEEKALLIKKGIEPEALTQERLMSIGRKGEGFTPEQQMRVAEAEVLPEPIPQTTEQITLDPSQQSLEETARRTKIFGEEVQSEALELASRQDTAIQRNIDELERKFSKTKVSKTPIEIGGEIQAKVTYLRKQANDAVAEAYDLAKQGEAFVPSKAIDDINLKWSQIADDMQLDIEDNPTIKRAFDRLREQGERFKKPGEGINIQDIEKIRKSVNTNVLGNAKPRSLEAKIGGKMTRAIDELIDNYIDGALMSGDPNAISQLRRARKMSSEFRKNFDEKDIVSKMTKQEGFGEKARLVMDADDVINALFGKYGISKKGVTSDIKKLKRILPESDVDALRQAAFLRLVNKRQGRDFNASTFSRQLGDALEQNPRLMRELFNPGDITLMKRFADVAKRVKTPVPGGANPSGTAAGIINALGRSFGPVGHYLGSILLRPVGKGIKAGQVREALTGKPPHRNIPGQGLYGATAAGAAKENRENN